MKCLFGHNYGKIEEGYQYCKQCGKARTVPCNHDWEIINEGSTYKFGSKTGRFYILQCNNCGDIKDKQCEYNPYRL